MQLLAKFKISVHGVHSHLKFQDYFSEDWLRFNLVFFLFFLFFLFFFCFTFLMITELRRKRVKTISNVETFSVFFRVVGTRGTGSRKIFVEFHVSRSLVFFSGYVCLGVSLFARLFESLEVPNCLFGQ